MKRAILVHRSQFSSSPAWVAPLAHVFAKGWATNRQNASRSERWPRFGWFQTCLPRKKRGGWWFSMIQWYIYIYLMYCRCSSIFSWMGWTWLKPSTNKHDQDMTKIYYIPRVSDPTASQKFSSRQRIALFSDPVGKQAVEFQYPVFVDIATLISGMTCVQVSPYLDFKEKVLTETACLNSLFCCSRTWRDCGWEETICDSICMSLYVYNFPGSGNTFCSLPE